jgi:TonB family protein
VDVGDATFLNTREWKFAGFFNRVKQNVAEVWNPMDAARVRDPTGNIYFNKDRTTVLSVTLNPQGTITEIKVARTSGLDFLDQTAIDAFEKAQPFVNPPPGLADSRGDIRFTFGFHVSTGGGGFKFFRGPGQ